jgi:hypothetical protein
MAEPKEVQLRRYVVRDPQHLDWHVFVIGSDGYFSTVGSYGNYSYWWSNTGTRDFRLFLIDLDDGYLIGKLHPQREYDGDETEKNIKEHIVRRRREGCMTKEEAREEWNLLKEEDLETREGFAFWWRETKIDDAHELSCYRHPAQVCGFAKKFWPLFVDVLRAELIAEGLLPPTEVQP